MELLLVLLLVAILVAVLAVVFVVYRQPAHHIEAATKLWRESFIREIREARLENRKLHKVFNGKVE